MVFSPSLGLKYNNNYEGYEQIRVSIKKHSSLLNTCTVTFFNYIFSLLFLFFYLHFLLF